MENIENENEFEFVRIQVNGQNDPGPKSESWDDCDIDDQEVLQQESISATLPVSPYGLKKPLEQEGSQYKATTAKDEESSALELALSPENQSFMDKKFQYFEESKTIPPSVDNEDDPGQLHNYVYLTDPSQFKKTIDFLEYNIKAHYNFINESYDFISQSYQSKNKLTKINILFTLRQIQLTFIMKIRDSIIFRKALPTEDFMVYLIDFISNHSIKESIVNKLDQIVTEITNDTINLQNVIIQLVNGINKNSILKELEILSPDEIKGLKQRLNKYAKKLWDMNQTSKYKSQNEIIISQLLMICLQDYKKINKYLQAMGYQKLFDKKFFYPRFSVVMQILSNMTDLKQQANAFQFLL